MNESFSEAGGEIPGADVHISRLKSLTGVYLDLLHFVLGSSLLSAPKSPRASKSLGLEIGVLAQQSVPKSVLPSDSKP